MRSRRTDPSEEALSHIESIGRETKQKKGEWGADGRGQTTVSTLRRRELHKSTMLYITIMNARPLAKGGNSAIKSRVNHENDDDDDDDDNIIINNNNNNAPVA